MSTSENIIIRSIVQHTNNSQVKKFIANNIEYSNPNEQHTLFFVPYSRIDNIHTEELVVFFDPTVPVPNFYEKISFDVYFKHIDEVCVKFMIILHYDDFNALVLDKFEYSIKFF